MQCNNSAINGLYHINRANHICYLVLILQFTAGGSHLCLAAKGTVDKPQYLEHCEYNYLKSVHMTGYKGARGQLEFLVHVVEKAPALEALTVDTALVLHDDAYVQHFCGKNGCSNRAALHARSCLGAILSPNVKLCVM